MSEESEDRRRRRGGMPTMDEVAALAGVSPMTVSRALRGQGPIRPETRARILKVAERLGYFPNLAASELASQTSRSVGIVVATLHNSIYAAPLEAAREVLADAGYDYVLQTIDYRRDLEPVTLRTLLARRVQAILIPSIGHDREARAIIGRLPVPHVEFGSRSPDNIGPAVGHSDYDAGLLATRRLLEAGRRRIALICGPSAMTSHARDRKQAYLDALAGAGLPPDPTMIREIDHTAAPAVQAFQDLLARHPAIDGLVIGGEIWAVGIMLEAARRGIAVPERLAVIGIGDVDVGPYLPVPLTVVALPRVETGRLAARMVVAMCQDEAEQGETVTLPIRLLARASA